MKKTQYYLIFILSIFSSVSFANLAHINNRNSSAQEYRPGPYVANLPYEMQKEYYMPQKIAEFQNVKDDSVDLKKDSDQKSSKQKESAQNYEKYRLQYSKYEAKYVVENEIFDPFEPVNRMSFAIHDVIDKVILLPAAHAYDFVLPQFGKDIVNNFLTNLGIAVTVPNQLLQGKFDLAFESVQRFLVNLTLGVFGMFDVASYEQMPYHKEDFGKTLAFYGVPGGPYLFVPILGPSNVRDLTGQYVDYDKIDPVKKKFDRAQNNQRKFATGLNKRSQNIDFIDNIKTKSIDPYSKLRSLYIQNRKTIVKMK